jgi:hypothetical protein
MGRLRNSNIQNPKIERPTQIVSLLLQTIAKPVPVTNQTVLYRCNITSGTKREVKRPSGVRHASFPY